MIGIGGDEIFPGRVEDTQIGLKLAALERDARTCLQDLVGET